MTITDTSETALLLMDYQVALCEDGPHGRLPPLIAQVEERDVLGIAAKVLAAAREREVFIAHVRLAFDPTYALRTNRTERFRAYMDSRAMLSDSPGARIVDEVAPRSDEPVVDKGCVDPFVGSNLLTVLHAEGVRNLVLGGVATNLVVESAARHATDAGFAVTVVEDMCASFSEEAHRFAMDTMLPMFVDVVPSADVLEVWS